MTLHDLAMQAAARLSAGADRNGDAYFLNVPVTAATEDDDDRTQMVTIASGPAGGVVIATDVGVIAPSIDLGAALEDAASHADLRLSARKDAEGRVLVVSTHVGADATADAVASLVSAVAAFADRLERSYFQA